jgi:hypothetical protein
MWQAEEKRENTNERSSRKRHSVLATISSFLSSGCGEKSG